MTLSHRQNFFLGYIARVHAAAGNQNEADAILGELRVAYQTPAPLPAISVMTSSAADDANSHCHSEAT